MQQVLLSAWPKLYRRQVIYYTTFNNFSKLVSEIGWAFNGWNTSSLHLKTYETDLPVRMWKKQLASYWRQKYQCQCFNFLSFQIVTKSPILTVWFLVSGGFWNCKVSKHNTFVKSQIFSAQPHLSFSLRWCCSIYTLLLKVNCKLILFETSKDLKALFKYLTLQLWIHFSEPSQQRLQATPRRRNKCNFVPVAWRYLVISWGSSWVQLPAIQHVEPRTNSGNSEAVSEFEGEEKLANNNIAACFML